MRNVFIVTLLYAMIISFEALSLLPIHRYDPKALLIFLDEQEQVIGPASAFLIRAISQNPGPIIASTSLLANIFPKDADLSENPKELMEKLKVAWQKGDEIGYEYEKRLMLIAAHFQAKKWVIKRINNSLCLLIPYIYLVDRKIDVDVVKAYKPAQISEVELQLGLKVNHMKTIDIAEIETQSNATANYFVNSLYDFRTGESEIFCMRADYFKTKSPLPLWSFLMLGHGTYHKTIVGIPLNKFKEVLDFFENQINTRFLMYISCYSAGLNAEKIYKDTTSVLQKTYQFAIVTQATTDAPVQGSFMDFGFDQSGKLALKFLQNFNQFFKDVTSLESINYQKAIKNIFPVLPNDEYSIPWNNIPQIKLPGLEWFSILADRENIVSIGSILSKAIDADRSLDIVKFFKTDPKIILLYALTIPFTLVINAEDLQAIISMVPGDAIHKIRKIDSKYDADTIFNWFLKIVRLSSEKIFFIGEIGDKKNIIIINHGVQADIESSIDSEVYYVQGSNLYRQSKFLTLSTPKLADQKQVKTYQDLLGKIAQKKQSDIFGITFESVKNIKEILQKRIQEEIAEKKIIQAQVDKDLLEKIEKEQQEILKKIKDAVTAPEVTQVPGLSTMSESLSALTAALNKLGQAIAGR